MQKTNFDAYLVQQLQDPEFAERFRRAGEDWNATIKSNDLYTTAKPRGTAKDRQEEEVFPAVSLNKQAVTPSSGNVFADLGLPDAEDIQIKAKLALRIVEIIHERKLSQTQAAQLLSVDQPKISALMRGKLDGFSMERLFRFLNALGRDVEIFIRPKPEEAKNAHVRVLAAVEA